jgi:hypothetical protein
MADDETRDVVVDADPGPGGSRRRIVVSVPARTVRPEERTVQAVVADAVDAVMIPPPAAPIDGGGGH